MEGGTTTAQRRPRNGLVARPWGLGGDTATGGAPAARRVDPWGCAARCTRVSPGQDEYK